MINFIDLAAQCAPDVSITTLASVIQHESAANPYAIGVNGNISLPRQPKNKKEAIAIAEWLKINGYDFDAGLGQINSRNLSWLKMRIPDLFDPCANLHGAATILSDCYKRASVQYEAGQPALHAALSCYNTGNFSAGISNGYVARVAKNATLQVPALLPMEKNSSLPIRLHAGYSQKYDTQRNTKQVTLDEGLPDAFDRKKQDAFLEAAKQGAEFIGK